MKRNMLSKLLSGMLVAVMVIGTIGCGAASQKEEEKTSTPASKETSTSEVVASSSEAVTESDEVTYPLETSDTLSIWTLNQIKPSSVYADYTESPFHKGLVEHTGVEVAWQYPAEGSSETQAYNLLLTEEVLPDIIFSSYTASDAALLLEDGIIYDLTEYLPTYAPDYWAYINSNDRYMKGVTTEDGKVFGVANFIEGDYNATFVGPVIRQDWLDECGLEAPVTFEDWENVLVTFKEKYGAVFGFSNNRMSTMGLASGAGAYSSFDAKYFVDDNGKIQISVAQPEWKAYMETLHKWYDMGLVDKDSVTMDDAGVRAKVLNNQIGVGLTAMSQLTNWVNDAKAENTGAEWVGFSYPRTAAGEPTCMIQMNDRVTGHYAVVTTSCPEDRLVTALKWLNYGFTEEGIKYWNFGDEGVSHKVDADGTIQWTDTVLNDPDGIAEASVKYTGTTGMGISIQASRLVQLRNSEASQNAVYQWIDNTAANEHLVPKGVCMTTDELARYSDKFAAIKTRVSEVAFKYLTGDESLDNYDAFIEELNGMGMQECVDIMQAAYDRYMAK